MGQPRRRRAHAAGDPCGGSARRRRAGAQQRTRSSDQRHNSRRRGWRLAERRRPRLLPLCGQKEPEKTFSFTKKEPSGKSKGSNLVDLQNKGIGPVDSIVLGQTLDLEMVNQGIVPLATPPRIFFNACRNCPASGRPSGQQGHKVARDTTNSAILCPNVLTWKVG